MEITDYPGSSQGEPSISRFEELLEFEEQAWSADDLDEFLQCDGCRKHPSQLPEYLSIDPELEFYSAPSEIVWNEEGTLNSETGRFLCNLCYIRAGMPSSPSGWKVGD